jgi:hypothetical protein
MGWSLVDHGHRAGEAAQAALTATVGPAPGPTGAQHRRRVSLQLAATVVQRLVDSLGSDAHLRPVRELAREVTTDLLGAPARLEVIGDEGV